MKRIKYISVKKIKFHFIQIATKVFGHSQTYQIGGNNSYKLSAFGIKVLPEDVKCIVFCK